MMKISAFFPLSIALTNLLLCAFSYATEGTKMRPHVRSMKGLSATDAAPYLDDAEFCLNLIEMGAQRFMPEYKIELEELSIVPAPISGGLAGEFSIQYFGPSDRSTMCHEVFHVFEQQGKHKKIVGLAKTTNGKTSPLMEAIPQVMAVLSTKDCLVGRQGRKEMAYNHCDPIRWSALPSLRETAMHERDLAKSYGLETSYWDKILKNSNAETLQAPSAYYSSIPLGYAIHRSLGSCDQIDLLHALLLTYSEASFRNKGEFDSIKTFTPAFAKNIAAIAGKACTEQFTTHSQEVELLP